MNNNTLNNYNNYIVAFYDIWPGKEEGLFLQLKCPELKFYYVNIHKNHMLHACMHAHIHILESFITAIKCFSTMQN